MKRYEVMIPVYWDQMDILQWSIPYIRKNLQPDSIVLIGPESMRGLFELEADMRYMDGNSLVEGMSRETIRQEIDSILSRNRIEKYQDRAGWYLQQFIKMAYAYHAGQEEYLVWDADIVPMRPISFYDSLNHTMKFMSGGKNHHMTYYQTMSVLFQRQMHPAIEQTYVAHYMLINADIMKELIGVISSCPQIHGGTWWKNILHSIPVSELQESGFSEFETYGEYVAWKYPGKYAMKDEISKITNTRTFFGGNPDEELLKWGAKCYAALGFEIRDKESIFYKTLCRLCCPWLPFRVIVGMQQFKGKVGSMVRHVKRKAGLPNRR